MNFMPFNSDNQIIIKVQDCYISYRKSHLFVRRKVGQPAYAQHLNKIFDFGCYHRYHYYYLMKPFMQILCV